MKQKFSKNESSIPIEDTEFWKEMNKNRIGHLLAGYRLKAGLTQKQLANVIGIKQNMVSEYENGKRKLSKKMFDKLSLVLKINSNQLY